MTISKRMGNISIDFRLSNDQRLYWALYGWDCESILVFNPKAIKLV